MGYQGYRNKIAVGLIVGLTAGLGACGVRGDLSVQPVAKGSTAPIDLRTTPNANILVGEGDTQTVLKPIKQKP